MTYQEYKSQALNSYYSEFYLAQHIRRAQFENIKQDGIGLQQNGEGPDLGEE